MSRFIGPIHHWLFKKIQKLEDIENALWAINAYEQDLEIIRDSLTAPIGTKSLEELVDEQNIHGSLQLLIQKGETRLASLVGQLLLKGRSEEELAKIFYQVGHGHGQEVLLEKDLSAEEAHGMLNNYMLDGMPCDTINNTSLKSQERMEWFVKEGLHKPYWEVGGVTMTQYLTLRKAYIDGFLKALNPTLTYELNYQEGLIQQSIS